MRGGSDSSEDFSGKKGNGYGHSNSDFVNCDDAMGNRSSILVNHSEGLSVLSKKGRYFGSVVHHLVKWMWLRHVSGMNIHAKL